MRYHIVVWYVPRPDANEDEQIPFVDEEFISGTSEDDLSSAIEKFIEEHKGD